MNLQEAIKIIKRATEKEYIKLQRGIAKRLALKKKMSDGDTPQEDDRIKWLDGLSEIILTLMREGARDYNRTHPNERITIYDFVDVIATVKMRLGLSEVMDDSEKFGPSPSQTLRGRFS